MVVICDIVFRKPLISIDPQCNFNGISWFSLIFVDIQCSLNEIHRFSLIFNAKTMEIMDCYWFLIEKQWQSTIFIAFSLKINENPWFPSILSSKINENQRFPLIFEWDSMKIHGLHWFLIENQWSSMILIDVSLKIKANPWSSLMFHWKSMKTTVSIRFSLIIWRKRRWHAADHTKRYV